MNRPHVLLAAAAATLLLIVLVTAGVSSAAVVIPSDPASVRSLDGTWRFKIEQVKGFDSPGDMRKGKLPVEYPATFEPFNQADYQETDGWHDIKVPGNWEMPGYSPATYNQP